jgi:hypothetical protein
MQAFVTDIMILRHPFSLLSLRDRDPFGLLAGGRGIERRFRMYSLPWSAHLKHTLEAQAEWSRSFSARGICSLLVLGAGRLYDLHLAAFPKLRLTLVDGDRGALSVWRRLHAQYSLTEITGVLPEWVRRLQAQQCTQAEWRRALDCIEEIPLVPHSPRPLTEFGCIPEETALLSLNLLSQIPLGWQTAVERTLIHWFGRRFVREREEEWVAAMSTGAKRLLELHLEQLQFFNAQTTLLIFDVEYLHYQGVLGKTPLLKPLTESEPGKYDPTDERWYFEGVKKPVRAQSSPALFDVCPEEAFPHLTLTERREWVWDIAPSTAHRVQALFFHKKP